MATVNGGTAISREKDGLNAQKVKGNWPNQRGFDCHYEERSPVELRVQGTIPAYATGVLYRTGPGGFKIETDKGNTFEATHWFDGFSQVHRFQLVPSNDAEPGIRVLYNSRIIAEGLMNSIKKGTLAQYTFGQKPDPTQTYLDKLTTMFKASEIQEDEVSTANIGVTLSVNLPGLESKQKKSASSTSEKQLGIKTLHTKTDSDRMEEIDPETLEPIAVRHQKELHPLLKGPMSSAHAKTDPKTGDFYNFNLDIGMTSVYRVFCTSASTGKTTILASIPAAPAYIHSFFLTSSHFILCIWNAHLKKRGLAVPWNRNMLNSIEPFSDSTPSKWYVVDRLHGKGLVTTYDGPAFFAFHSINAWEEHSASDPSKIDIVADVVAHDGLDMLWHFEYSELMSGTSPASACASLRRFRLPDIPSSPTKGVRKASVEWTSIHELGPEMPTMNAARFTLPHRYTYACTYRGKSTLFDGLVKFDNATRTSVIWEKHGHTPGEAIFVADPEGTEEDDGVLLSVVLDGEKGDSYLMCLDARNMKELGRAEVNGPVGFGFHGAHVPSNGKYTGDL